MKILYLFFLNLCVAMPLVGMQGADNACLHDQLGAIYGEVLARFFKNESSDEEPKLSALKEKSERDKNILYGTVGAIYLFLMVPSLYSKIMGQPESKEGKEIDRKFREALIKDFEKSMKKLIKKYYPNGGKTKKF